jgi:hypothetical protein
LYDRTMIAIHLCLLVVELVLHIIDDKIAGLVPKYAISHLS